MPLSTESPTNTVPTRGFQRPAWSSPSRRRTSPAASKAGAATRSPTAKCKRNGCSSAGTGASCRRLGSRSKFRSIVGVFDLGLGDAEEDLSEDEPGADRDEQRLSGVIFDPVEGQLGRLARPLPPRGDPAPERLAT